MSLWKIAWKSIEHRSLASTLTALSMALGVALVVSVLVVNGVVGKSFQQGAQGYDLIVGAKGSKLQLVLSTVFYNQDPVGLIPYEYYEYMRSSRYSAEVKTAIPIARGDNYQGSPVVATTPDYFQAVTKSDGKPYTLQKGEFFKNVDYTGAVIGYAVAKKNKLQIGDEIRFGHTNSQDERDLHEPFKVVGILDHTGSPNDRAVFVNLEGFYREHEHNEGTEQVNYELREQEVAKKRAELGLADPTAELAEAHEHEGEEGEEHEHEHEHGRRLTAILLITKDQEVQVAGTAEQVEAASQRPGVEIAESELVTPERRAVIDTAVTALPAKIEGELLEAQAVAPVQEIAAFFQDVIGNIQSVLIIFAIQVVIVAGVGMMVSIYNSMNERRQEIAIMRALGARRSTVMAIVLFESILLSLGGGFLGAVIGHLAIGGLAPFIMSYANVMVHPWDFQLIELVLIPCLVALASVVGYLPAVVAYRTDVAQALQS
ncbi:MAG: ABC transporter permease [Thermoguttaceae bacterium]|nr:ABC transporter permease [Thermoguttaceae bacterium]MBQ2039090.1 ABC transporter permease [Thermoguttaceae bacterium]MBQ2556913.1 ABC transporter permease [Thermoguttaceae bacterium]MBQ4202125.1 ABC transporter permease [Thermoguttaceae bacterium]MBQ5367647.1 ABC transporter permease [Thermoguttaceae bacterium]